MSGLRICLVASNRHPVREPFAGGLEAHTHTLARALRARGHDVSLFAAPGSDPALGVTDLPAGSFTPSPVAAADINAPAVDWLNDHHAYLELMLQLAGPRRDDFDVVHDHSLHHLPVAMAHTLGAPVVTTVHTPPLPWLESAFALSPGGARVTAVSAHCAATWAACVDATVVRNGVDTALWHPGAGGGDAVWSGRLTPEKAPHEAIDACRLAGVPLQLVGPVSDRAYFEAQVRPRLGGDVAYLGHFAHGDLVDVVGRASVALVTPAWDEPYGLVAAESMACGTPLAGYARGALPEVVGTDAGVLVEPGDVVGLAGAVHRARRLDRQAVRAVAERDCSLQRMVDQYEQVYAEVLDSRLWAA